MKRFITLLMFSIIPMSGIRADNFGRLFFSLEQRAQLDYEHAHETAVDDTTTSALTVNGIVQQHGGTRTVWINGKAQFSGQGGNPAVEAVAVPGKSQAVKIKVGQKLILDTSQSFPAAAE